MVDLCLLSFVFYPLRLGHPTGGVSPLRQMWYLVASAEDEKALLEGGRFLPSVRPFLSCQAPLVRGFGKGWFLLRCHRHIVMSSEFCIVSVSSYSIEPFPAIHRGSSCSLSRLALLFKRLSHVTPLVLNGICPPLMNYTLVSAEANFFSMPKSIK